QIRGIQDPRLLAEILANALLFREGISHRIHLDLQNMKNARTVAAAPFGTAARRALWGARAPGRSMAVLLDDHLGAGFLELLLHRVDVGLGHGILDQGGDALDQVLGFLQAQAGDLADRKSTRLNSSHVKISYAVFCLKKK